MNEIPETVTIRGQVVKTLTNKKITEVVNATSPHKFAWYNGDPAEYHKILAGKQILNAKGHGMFVDIICDGDTYITIGDGTNIRYYSSFEQSPPKHQLLIKFEDDSCVAFTISMYGGIWAYKETFDNKYHRNSLNSISPLDNNFNEPYFENLIKQVSKDISVKALLATEQRIPGLGNGVLQDILFNASIHPKRKISQLSDSDKEKLFKSLKTTLRDMTDMGGRDIEKDLFGNNGGYKTILSKNTLGRPCPNCGSLIEKEAFMGGAIYFCPTCQLK